ncbi:MAG: nucleotidyltransferase substrate binding protein [bacterium]
MILIQSPTPHTLIDGIDVQSLLNAYAKFEEFRQDLSTEKDRTATIQAFEFCFELSWKTMKRLLNKRSVPATSPREIIRAAGAEGFIKDDAQPSHKASASSRHINNSFTGSARHSSKSDGWFEFLAQRNYAAHCYDEELAENVVEILPLFSAEIKQFLITIGALHDPA